MTLPPHYVEGLQKGFELGAFLNGSDGRFGFGGALEYRGVHGDFLDIRAPMPPVRKVTEELCKRCNGTGKDEDLDRECLRCEGEKQNVIYDHHGTHAVSATLSLLLEHLEFYKEGTSASVPQLLIVRLGMRAEPRAYFVGGMYSIPLVNVLKKFSAQRDAPAMTDAMRSAYDRMVGVRPYMERFYARVDDPNGWLNVSCPGQACSLNPHHDGIREGYGYEFSDHNVDTAFQQLTLLAGLAALHDAVRRELT